MPSPGLAQTPATRRSVATLRAVGALMIREMATRYGRSPGGYLWAVLEPMGGILILALGFSLLFRNPPLGNSFLLFYATGMLPFTLYQSVSLAVGRSIQFSRALLMYPSVTWADAVLARFVLNALTELLVVVILVVGILAITDTRAVLDPLPIGAALGLALLVSLGVGTLNCALFGLFPVWAQVWSIITRPLFIASGIFFIFDDLPPVVQDILWWNPLIHVVGLMRMGFYPTYPGHYISVGYTVVVSLLMLFFGVLLLARYHRTILNDDR